MGGQGVEEGDGGVVDCDQGWSGSGVGKDPCDAGGGEGGDVGGGFEEAE